MDTQRWKRIEEILDAALDVETDQQDALVESLCGDDAGLQREVKSLLGRRTRASKLLDGSVVDMMSPDADSDLLQSPPDIGPYRLKRLIGRGGMGSVYEAERADGAYEHTVAVKLLPLALASGAQRTRFHTERQILARLRHPGIARLLDGGTTDDGRQYLVMEFVDGTRIDDYCDQERLTIAERIALFVDVCRAVQFAHTNLVVHRDLKPSNIFITRNGEAQLLDFGIAKLLNEDASDVTQTRFRAMTPEYAAPEQVTGSDVTTATDVYSLGVLLYELLAGVRPYSVASASAVEIERAVCATTPPRPSTAIAKVDDGIFKNRSTRADKLQRRLAGDLDVIIGKAMSKEPSRRYASAGDMMRDLERHLAGKPVEARGDGLGYRARTFVRRNKIGVTTGIAVVFALAAGLSLALWQASIARSERDRARVEQERAEEVTGFITGLFERASPEVARGDTIDVFELLELGAADIDSLAGQPAVHGQLLSVLGDVYFGMGDVHRADSLFRRAFEVRLDHFGPEHPDVARSLHDLGSAANKQGDLGRADSLFRRALAVIDGTVGRQDPQAHTVLNMVGIMHYLRREFAEAESVFAEVVRLSETDEKLDRNEYIARLNNLANSIYNQGRYGEAADILKSTMFERMELLGPDHPKTAFSMKNYANVLNRAGEFEEARRYAAAALDVQQRVLLPNHFDIPHTYYPLSDAMKGMGKVDSAYTFLYRALEIQRNHPEPNYPDLSITYRRLAALALSVEDGAAALDHAMRQKDAAVQGYGDSTRFVVAAAVNVARAYLVVRRPADAVRELKPWCMWMDSEFGPADPRSVECDSLVADAKQEMRQDGGSASGGID